MSVSMLFIFWTYCCVHCLKAYPLVDYKLLPGGNKKNHEQACVDACLGIEFQICDLPETKYLY
jgi:hypothetical protein